MNRLTTCLFLSVTMAGQGLAVPEGPTRAFPGAEGYGRFTTGGRGGTVLIVSNLNDSGPGSLRAAIAEPGPRFILFSTSGTIVLRSSLTLREGNVTIAGQTAPGDGICLRDYPLSINADNVILRYLRFRLGDSRAQEADSLGGRFHQGIIVDHCSASWSVDECVSFYANSDFTLQWCLISESLNDSVHSKGPHGYGGIWGGRRATFHHNLLAHHNSRNPRFSGSDDPTAEDVNHQLDFYNNVIYNWAGNSVYGGEMGEHNMINNYYKPGPATSGSKRWRIVEPSLPYGKFYVSGNHVEGNESVTQDNWDGGVQCDDPMAASALRAFPTDAIVSQSAATAYVRVLDLAGASLVRDAVDRRIVEEVATGTASHQGSSTGRPGIIDSQNDVGGWPTLAASPALPDGDSDGMPDTWERDRGLDPTDPSDANGRILDEDYDNVEVYLNDLVAPLTLSQGIPFDCVVARDGSGDFDSLQAAIDAVPNNAARETRIFVKRGVYKEKITLSTAKRHVTLVGEDVATTIVTYDDYASKLDNAGNTIGTSGSSGFFLNGDDVTVENMTFENSSGPVGQAVAMRVDGDRVAFYNCRFLGFQDTLYTHGNHSRQYYQHCHIEGTVDFIFGASTAFFDDCQIVGKGSGYVTAASTDQGNPYGFVFQQCHFISEASARSYYLGRPWRDYANVVLIACELDNHIRAEGWHNWDQPAREQTAFYAEYQSTGPGANAGGRVPWSHQLTEQQAQAYTIDRVLGDWDPSRKTFPGWESSENKPPVRPRR